MAGVMVVLTTPILLCSTPGPPLNSKDRAGTAFETSSTLPLQRDSENDTTALGNTILIDGQILSNCQKDLKTFNSTLNSCYPDQWPGKLVTSLCAYNGSINNLGHFSQVKRPKKTSEEIVKIPKDAFAKELGTGPHYSFVKYRPIRKHDLYRLHFSNNVPPSSSSFQVLMALTKDTFNLVKSFHHYRKSHKICPLREGDVGHTELKVIASSFLIEFGLERKLMEELRGRIVDDQNKTTVCLTKTVYCFKNAPPKS
ncbi:hypothetical protein PoB_002545100 [Plakobranchus ocellatus]|uniref:Uncharacterized protein n=1 Tax=Plakobranchus ocellatus TaxID=259542 RepID=A0AAV3ZIJ8_9GAST|nr:hypothetical protein PoB_002545100 [Plakobranchus ocellatus]